MTDARPAATTEAADTILAPLRPDGGPLSACARATKATLTLGGLAAALAVIHGGQIASMLAWPFSRKAYRAINRTMADSWWGLCVRSTEDVYGTMPRFTGDDPPHGENAIVLSNHLSMVDIPALFGIAIRKGRLGDLKWMVKDAVKWVPGIGWGMVFLGCVFLKRDWAKDRKRIEATFSGLVDNDVPAWLTLFPEGTRMTPEKRAHSRAFAEKSGHQPPRNVMVPRTRGFTASVMGLRAHADAVYDITIAYPDGLPTLVDLAAGAVPSIHMHIERFEMSELPESREALADWLLERYRAKDELLDGFLRDGCFPGPERSIPR